MGTHQPVEYATAPPGQDELTKLKGSIRLSAHGNRIVGSWTCPRCEAEHPIDEETDRRILQFDIETVAAPRRTGILDLICNCGLPHKGPDGSHKLCCGFAANLPVSAP